MAANALPSGGYDCDFVESLPNSLQCPVCLLPFRDPHLLSCCGQKACDYCIGRIRAVGHPCPICQQPFTTLLDKQLHRKVLDLRVYCSMKDKGCDWTGELRDLETHSQRACGCMEVECQYKCGGRYQRRLLRKHEMEECPQRPMMRMMEAKISLMVKKEVELSKLQEHQHVQSDLKKQIVELTERLATSHEQHVHNLKVFQENAETRLASLEARLAMVERRHDTSQTKLEPAEEGHQDHPASLSAVRKDLAKQDQLIRELHKKNAVLHDDNIKFKSMLDSFKSQLSKKGKSSGMQTVSVYSQE